MEDKNKKVLLLVGGFVLVLVALVFFVFTGNKNTPMVEEEQNINQNQVAMTKEIPGLKITVTKDGEGEQYAKDGDIVYLNYDGKLPTGSVFDSNIDPKFNHVTPFSFEVGSTQVVKGFADGVWGMKIGEKRTLEMTSDLAYGENGIPGVIPPNSSLIFDVELVKIEAKTVTE